MFSGGKSESIIDESKKEDASAYLMDIRKAKEIINWEPAYSLKEAFIDMKKNGVKGAG